MDEGPYRQSGATPCPRCGAALTADTGSAVLTCGTGCGGTWYPPEVFAEAGPVLEGPRAPSVWWKQKPATQCPVCREELEQIGLSSVAVHHCSKHGMWLDRGTREVLERDFAATLGRHRAVSALAALLASRDPAALRDIATLLIDLEGRVAYLEQHAVTR